MGNLTGFLTDFNAEHTNWTVVKMSNPARDWTPANIHTLPSASQKIADDEVDLSEFIGLFLRRKWLILSAMLLSIILGFLYIKQATRLFPAEAKLILESQDQNATGLESLAVGISDEDSEMNSQIEVIKSRRLIGQVVDSLKLYEDPEFVPSLDGPSLRIQVITWIKAAIGQDVETVEKTPSMLRQKAIDELTKNLNAVVLPNTYVFRISLESQSPDKSVEIVNTLAQIFVEDQIVTKQESTADAAKWLKNKVSDLEKILGNAEAEAAKFRSETERAVTKEDLAQSNLNLKNARGRLESFTSNLESVTGSRIPTTDRDLSRMNALLRDINELEAIVEKQTNDSLVILQMDREAEAAKNIYEYFAGRLNEIEVQQELQKSDVRILSAAVPRLEPTKPKKALTLAIFGILGLLLGVGYVVISKFMDRSFNDPADLQRAFGIPVIGAVARAPVTSRKALLNYVLKRPSSAIMESVRDMRTSIFSSDGNELDASGDGGKVVVFTSSIPAEGKTTSSVLLAINSAALEKKVLLVECDLRRSTFKTYFGPRTELGLLDALNKDESWSNAIWENKKMNIDVIFGGISKGRNAADIFASSDFSKFIERVKDRYDLIVLDAPPVLPVPDARLIAKLSNKIIYVVSSGATPSSTVAAGLRLFETMNLKIDGFALTQIKKNKNYGYGTYGRYGYGSEYYKN